jgi:hypothetical protein
MSTKRLHVSLPGLPKVGLYISLLLLPGGFIGLLLVCWLERRAGSRRPEGTTRMWYSQMLGWRDLLPGLWRLATSRPRLKTDIGRQASGQSPHEPAARYLTPCGSRA